MRNRVVLALSMALSLAAFPAVSAYAKKKTVIEAREFQRQVAKDQRILQALNRLTFGPRPGDKLLAYNSVLTTIRILEKKGYVSHAKDGRAYIYAPLVERSEATRSEVRHLVQRLFQNSHELLVLNILEDSGLSDDELQRLKQYLRGLQ